MLSRIRSWIFACKSSKRHIRNWYALILLATLRRKGTFYDRYGNAVDNVDAMTLLKKVVRLEKLWTRDLSAFTISFSGDSIKVPVLNGSMNLNYPLHSRIICGPKNFKGYEKEYGVVNVSGKIVLDVGAFIGDTPIYWVYKGARKVYAIEPVPEHYELLCLNAKGLPIIPILGSVGCKVPKVSELKGLGTYGLLGLLRERIDVKDVSEWLDVPQYSLVELVDKYKPDVIKIDCEGCEHYILDEIITCRGRDVVVEFHDIPGNNKEDSLAYLKEHLGKPIITSESKSKGVVTAAWLSNDQ